MDLSPSERIYRRNMAVFRIAKLAQSLTFVIPVWVAYERQFLSFTQFTTIEAILIGTQIFFDLPTGVIADIFGRKVTILLGFFLWGVALLYYGFCRTFPAFTVYAMIWGIGNSFTSGAWEALMYDTLKEAGKEQTFSIETARQSMIFQFGYAFACIVGGWIGSISFLYTIWATAISCFVGSVIALWFIEPHIDSYRYTFFDYLHRMKVGAGELIKNRHIAKISLFYVLVGSLTWTAQVVFNATLLTQLGYTSVEFGYAFGGLRLFSGVVLFQMVKKLHLVNRSSVFLFFPIILMIGFLPGILFTKWIALPFVWILMFSSTARWSILGKYTNAEYSSKNRATALSALSTCINLIYVVIMLASGPVMEYFGGVKTVFTLLGIITAISVFPLGIHLALAHKGKMA